MTDQFPRIQGRCPMGCGDTLFVGSGGYITCSLDKCPNPTAVADLLLDHCTPHHVVVLGEYSFDIKHPLRERLNDDLFECQLHKQLDAMTGPPMKPGRYEVGGDGAYWWRELPAVPAVREETNDDR